MQACSEDAVRRVEFLAALRVSKVIMKFVRRSLSLRSLLSVTVLLA